MRQNAYIECIHYVHFSSQKVLLEAEAVTHVTNFASLGNEIHYLCSQYKRNNNVFWKHEKTKDKNDIYSTYLCNTQVVVDFWGIETAQLKVLIRINVLKVRFTRCCRGPRKAKLLGCNHSTTKNTSICQPLWMYLQLITITNTSKQPRQRTFNFAIWKETQCFANKIPRHLLL